MPTCLRFTQLQRLDLESTYGRGTISELPEWLGTLPLVVLRLNKNHSLATLPLSLNTVTTLRIIELVDTKLSGPFLGNDQEFSRYGDPNQDYEIDHERAPVYLWNGLPIEMDDVAPEEISRRDGILRGISEALPDLRLKLHRVNGGAYYQELSWWHADCFFHWTDRVFIGYANESEVFEHSETSGSDGSSDISEGLAD